MNTIIQTLMIAFYTLLVKQAKKKGNFDLPTTATFDGTWVYFDATPVWETDETKLQAVLGNGRKAWRQMDKMLQTWKEKKGEQPTEPTQEQPQQPIQEAQPDVIEEVIKVEVKVSPTEAIKTTFNVATEQAYKRNNPYLVEKLQEAVMQHYPVLTTPDIDTLFNMVEDTFKPHVTKYFIESNVSTPITKIGEDLLTKLDTFQTWLEEQEVTDTEINVEAAIANGTPLFG